MKRTITWIVLLGVLLIPQFSDAQVSSLRQEKDLVWVKLLLPGGKGSAECSLETSLDSAATLSVNISQKSAGEFEVRKKVKSLAPPLVAMREDEACDIVETISTTPDGIKWTVEITGTGKSWSRPILTALKWRNPSGIDFWTTWSDNQLLNAPEQWQDPFLSAPLTDMELKYGGTDHLSRKAFVIPAATSFFNKKTSAASFLSSPQDSNLDMDLVTHANGSIAYRHSNHRINHKNKIRFTMYLTAHEADWRGGLAKYYKLYPEYFTVKEPLADEMAGCASYSAYEGELDAEKYKQMAYSINWKASVDFPYMSMFLPYTKTDEEKWTKMKQEGVTIGDGLCSIEQLRSYSERFRKKGFYTLSYFNVTEAGSQIKKEMPRRKASAFEDWQTDANDFIYYKMRNAVIVPPDYKFPVFSWDACVVMDPGEPVFQQHLLTQAKRHIEKIPASSGICIDRLDWLRWYNMTRDDGLAFVNGQETASILTSWKTLLGKLGPLMHQSHKVIFCNPLLRRIDVMEEMDGIYDEFGHFWQSLNLCSQMATHRPMIAWTASPKDFKPNPDFYFQTHLYMGAFLTAPIQGNDHTITPDEAIEKYYFDYGKMLMALRGRKWLLQPNAIKVVNENVNAKANTSTREQIKANIFEVGGKAVLIPVIHGKDNDLVKLVISLPDDYLAKKTWKISVLYPDRNDWKVISSVKPSKQLPLKINLMRGCAMVKIMAND